MRQTIGYSEATEVRLIYSMRGEPLRDVETSASWLGLTGMAPWVGPKLEVDYAFTSQYTRLTVWRICRLLKEERSPFARGRFDWEGCHRVRVVESV